MNLCEWCNLAVRLSIAPSIHVLIHLSIHSIFCLTRISLVVDSGFCFLFDRFFCWSNFIPHTAHNVQPLSICLSACPFVMLPSIHLSIHPFISIPPSILPSLTRGVDGGVHYYRASQNRVSFYYKSLWSPWLPKLQARLLTHKKGCAAENQPPQ